MPIALAIIHLLFYFIGLYSMYKVGQLRQFRKYLIVVGKYLDDGVNYKPEVAAKLMEISKSTEPDPIKWN
jgi:hypothetical protein